MAFWQQWLRARPLVVRAGTVCSLARLARGAEAAFQLGIRISLGSTFAMTGYGKLTHLERTIAFFRELSIPLPEVQAPFIGALELAGGVAIVLGLFTRLVSLPLAGTMLVAIATALWPDVSSPMDLVTLDETLYLLLLGSLVVSGPGRLSLDHWLARRVPALQALARQWTASWRSTSVLSPRSLDQSLNQSPTAKDRTT